MAESVVWHTDSVRLRLLLIACALVVLAFAGLRHASAPPVDPIGALGTTGHLSTQPAPEPALPAVITEATTAAPTTPAPLTSGGQRHLRPADPTVIVNHPPQPSATHATRPLTFPLLI